MNYEKKYKEAQKWIESIYSELSHEQQMEAEAFFPELKESEDERIRKSIIKFLIDVNNGAYTKSELETASWIAWLEKQGEQKVPVVDFKAKDWYVSKVDGKIHNTHYSVDKVQPKFNVGDWVVTSYGKVNQVITVDKDGDGFTLDDDTYFSGSWKDGYHLWSIADAKEGDVLVASDESLFIFARTKDNAAYYHYSLCKNGSQEISDGKHAWEVAKDCHPATKEQRDTLFAKMREAGYEWDAEKKELKKIEQKSAWSKEDTFKVQRICKYLDEAKKYYADITEVRDCIDWLKSIKERIGGNV